MGARGAVPNRSDDLSRPRDPARGVVTKGELRPVTIPPADSKWHPIAKRLYNAAKKSGQSDFYQDTDWAILWSLCEDLSFYKTPFTTRDGVEYQKRSGQMLQSIYSTMSSLLLTEGDRRRVRIELTAPRPEQASAAVIALAAYREELGVTE